MSSLDLILNVELRKDWWVEPVLWVLAVLPNPPVRLMKWFALTGCRLRCGGGKWKRIRPDMVTIIENGGTP